MEQTPADPHRSASKRSSRIDWDSLRHNVLTRMTPTAEAPSPGLPTTEPPPPKPTAALQSAPGRHKPARSSDTRRDLLRIALPFALTLSLTLLIGLTLAFTLHTPPPTSPASLPLPHGATPGPYAGELTFYTPALGSCGWANTSAQAVCAVAHALYDAAAAAGATDPNANRLCGMRVRVSRTAKNGTVGEVVATVVDRCEGCAPRDLDLSPALFDMLAEADEGRVQGSWDWVD